MEHNLECSFIAGAEAGVNSEDLEKRDRIIRKMALSLANEGHPYFELAKVEATKVFQLVMAMSLAIQEELEPKAEKPEVRKPETGRLLPEDVDFDSKWGL